MTIEMLIYNGNELVIFSDLNTPESINYLKKILLDLIYGPHKEYVSKLYYECDKEGREGRCGRLGKLTFFIYVLSAHEGHFWTRNNFRDALLSKAIIKAEEIKNVLNTLDKLQIDPDIERIFKGKTYEYQNIYKIVYRYQKDHKALVEKKFWKVQSICRE